MCRRPGAVPKGAHAAAGEVVVDADAGHVDPAGSRDRQPLVDGNDGLGGQHPRLRVAAPPRDPQDLGALLLPDVGDLQADGLGARSPENSGRYDVL
jgi:hypothetical protein